TIDVSGISFASDAYYLGVEVATDGEMTPRKLLGSVPQAIMASALDDSTADTGYIDIQGDASIGGNVGIGTSADANYALKTDGGNLYFQTAGTNYGRFWLTGNNLQIDLNDENGSGMSDLILNSTGQKSYFESAASDNGWSGFTTGGSGSSRLGMYVDSPTGGSGEVAGLNYTANFSGLNTSGDGYTAFRMNVTDAQAGADGSRYLMDLQTDSASQFKVNSTGTGLFAGSLGVGDTTNGKFGGSVVGSVAINANPHDILLSGQYAYVTGGANGLTIVDIADPKNPQVVGSYTTNMGNVPGMALYGNYALLPDQNGKLTSVDISNPASPVLGSEVTTNGAATSIALFSNYAYVANAWSGNVDIFDVTDPSSLSAPVNTINTGSYSTDVYVSGDYLYVDDYTSLKIYDINNSTTPDAPVLVGSYEGGGLYSSNVVVSEGYAYLSNDWRGIVILNVGNPASPSLAAGYSTENANVWNISVSGNSLYVPIRNGYLAVVDISDPNNPVQESITYLPPEPLSAVTDGSYVYVVDYSSGEFKVMNLTDAKAGNGNLYVQAGAAVSQGLTIGGAYDPRYVLNVMGDEMRFARPGNGSYYTHADIGNDSFGLGLKNTTTNNDASYFWMGENDIWLGGTSGNSAEFFLDNKFQVTLGSPADGTRTDSSNNAAYDFRASFADLNSANDGYTGFKLNIADAQAGALGSRYLMDLQLGNVSKFAVDSGGNIYQNGSLFVPSPIVNGDFNSLKLTNQIVTSGEQYAAYTQLLLHADGVQDSTVFADEVGHTVTAMGDAFVDTNELVFGTGSAKLNTTGVDGYLNIDNSPDFVFGTGDFTVEMFIKTKTASPPDQALFSNRSDNPDGDTVFSIEFYGGGSVLNVHTNATVLLQADTAITDTDWHHVALSRSGTSLKLFLDGDEVASATNSMNFSSQNDWHVGADLITGGTANFEGQIDEMRIIKGRAVYTSSFTPPVAPFTLSPAVLAERTVFWSQNDFTQFGDSLQNTQLRGLTQSFYAGATEAMTIDANGNVGIGTATPGAKLEVVGDIISKGTEWTARSAAEANAWTSVAYGNGLFVAVSQDGTNRVMTSSDGVNWTAQSAANANGWDAIVYGNGLFVAISYDGANQVMTSPDGINWTARNAAASNTWYSIVYGNGIFVAVSVDGTNRVMTSPDGVNWTSQSAAENNAWTSVTYGNGLFLAVSADGTNRIMTSSDGITWTSQSAAENNAWRAVTYGNGLFVAVSSDGTNRVMTSPDGVTWTARVAAEVHWWQSVTYGNGLFVAVALFDGVVMTSPDGVNWTSRSIPESNEWISVAYGNGLFVAVSIDGTNRVMTSGKPEQNLIATNNIYQGGMSIFGNVGIGTTSPSTRMHVRLNEGVITDVGDPNAIAVFDNPGSNGANAYINALTGQDDVNYDFALDGTERGGFRYNVVGDYLAIHNSGGNEALIVDGAGNVGIGTAIPGARLEVVGDIISKGTEWTARSAAEANQWQSITYGNGLFVAVSSTGTNRVMTSTDGVNWTAQSVTEDSYWTSVTYGNGLFVAVAAIGSNRVMTSPDGINWTMRNASDASAWLSVTYGNGLFVAVANAGTNLVMTSPDGINWTSQNAAEANAWISVVYGDGLFVAVATVGTDQVMTSPDGINWTPQSEAEANQWISVTYGNGLFVAVANTGTNRVMTSPNGTLWTSRSAAENNGWVSVTYGNGIFVAISFDGTNQIMTSPDGINWTTRGTPMNETWKSVVYGNGAFVSVSTHGPNYVMTSGKPEQNLVATNNIYQGGMNIFGNVGLGDTTPDHLLDVAGNIGLDASSYLNFGDTDGTSGYGLRDNAGAIEYKNSGGSWASFGSGGPESDPIFSASAAAGIAGTDITNWNTAYSWGDHSLIGYITDGNTNWDNSYGFITDLSTFTTDDLTQGTTNLYSQWATSGSDIHYSAGNVGIGTTNPYSLLTVGTYNSASSAVAKQGLFSVDNMLLSQLEGGAYFGRVGLSESSLGLSDFGSRWVSKTTSRNYWDGAMSSDGAIQTAVIYGSVTGQGIYVSTDYGTTWIQKSSTSRNYHSVAMSSDGKVQTALVYRNAVGQGVYVSTDYGTTWIQKDSTSRDYQAVAMSSDGKIQTAVISGSVAGQGIYVSTDYGTTWVQKDSNARDYQAVAMSSDGKVQTAVINGSAAGQGVYVSTDYGITWAQKDSNGRNYTAVAMTSDGKIQTTTVSNGYVYTSGDYGTTWVQGNITSLSSVAMSSDGKIQTVLGSSGIYSSTDYGTTWIQKDATFRLYISNAMSSDGKIQMVVVNSGGIYVSHASISTLGYMGIGDTTPDHLLDVAGNIGLDASSYVNFGDTDGTTGYGLRDNAGAIEYKDASGSWIALNTLGGGSLPSGTEGQMLYNNAGTWTAFSGMIWNDTSSYLGIGTAVPTAKLDVTGDVTNATFINSELITGTDNTDFASSLGNWTQSAGTNWSWSGGTAVHAPGSTGYLSLATTYTSSAPVIGHTYLITFAINTTATGTLAVSFGSGGGSGGRTFGAQTGTETQTVVTKSTNVNSLRFTPSSAWAGTIDNVSVKEITASNATEILRNSDGTIGLEIRSGGTSYRNTFVGIDAGLASYNTTGTEGKNNSAFGDSALSSNSIGTGNVAMGYNALKGNTLGNYNVSMGNFSLYYNTLGIGNTAMGYHAGDANTTGSNNLFLGYQAGDNISTGSNNIIIGYDIDSPTLLTAGGGSNQLNIGNLIFANNVDGTGTTISTGIVGIGDNSPAYGGLVVAKGVVIGSDADQNALIDDATNGSGSTVLYIGQNTIDTTAPSDERLKHNIQATNLSLDQLLGLNVVDFQYLP
ncbi:hypothetical protein EPO05_01105, partial [Patescibacteria group bacterium]